MHDEDAFNAILGVLQHWVDRAPVIESCYYVWGLPFHKGPHNSENIVTPIDWFHYNPSRRRKTFPSWSPLGWAGPKFFHGYSSTIPLDLDLRLRCNTAVMTFQEYVAPGIAAKLSDSQTAPSHLELVRGLTFPLDLVKVGEEICAIFQVAADMSTYEVSVWWDEKMIVPMERDGSFLGLVLNESRVMVLVERDGLKHYERVGIIQRPPTGSKDSFSALLARHRLKNCMCCGDAEHVEAYLGEMVPVGLGTHRHFTIG
jgi:hypothetical protein